MSTSPAPLRITPQQYLEDERRASFKSEYVDGDVYLMTGASEPHTSIASNTIMALGPELRPRSCKIYGGDLKVWIPANFAFVYPDLTIVRGKPRMHDGRGDVIENPLVIFEILSPSTEKFDRGRKFRMYRSIPSLKQYVLVAQDEPRVELYTRDPNGFWIYSEYASLDAIADFSAIQVQIALAHIYEQVEFNP
jgi:Uma2 family endonuclease